MSRTDQIWYPTKAQKRAAFAYFEAFPGSSNFAAEQALHIAYWHIVDLRSLYTTEKLYQQERRKQRALSA